MNHPSSLEIERKFLVRGEAWRAGTVRHQLVQGYLARGPGATVRLRRRDDEHFLTIKGPSQGVSRVEVEMPVDRTQAAALWPLCLPSLVEKTRHVVTHEGHVWEIDEFHGANAGLIVAEIELTAPDEAFVPPPWLGPEVTADHRYRNSSLSTHPWSSWPA